MMQASVLSTDQGSAGLAGAWRQHDLTQSKNGSFMAEERVNRKLAAILASDVVGYSRLMRADEAGTLARHR
jgi:class 3 adenylate cyclase